MKAEALEIILVLIIISIQLWVFVRTFKQIQIFKNVIPNLSSLKMETIFVPPLHLKQYSTEELLHNVSQYKEAAVKVPAIPTPKIPAVPSELLLDEYEPSEDFEESEESHENGEQKVEERVEISIMDYAGDSSSTFKQIMNSINTYLIRNKHASSDFNLIKDIVERNADTIEEDINLTIAIPLYLGLMGTMLGIVIGLYSMSDITTLTDNMADKQLGNGISVLLGGVKIAMIASFTGLLFTIINSGWFFKGSKSKVESQKNQFYTYLQTELLPIVNESMNTTFQSLQQNLMKFNAEFSTNLTRLGGLFDKNHATLQLQDKVLTSISRTKVSEMTSYNARVLKELNSSLKEFERFNATFQNLNSFAEGSVILTSRVNNLLERTSNFEVIASTLSTRLEESQALLTFLQSHFKALDERKHLIQTTVIDVDNSISEAITQLKEHTQSSITRVKEFAIDEVDALKTALSESRTNLGNLAYLEKLNVDVAQFKANSDAQGEKIRRQLDSLNTTVEATKTVLQQFVTMSETKKQKGVLSFFKKLMTKKKKEAENES